MRNSIFSKHKMWHNKLILFLVFDIAYLNMVLMRNDGKASP